MSGIFEDILSGFSSLFPASKPEIEETTLRTTAINEREHYFDADVVENGTGRVLRRVRVHDTSYLFKKPEERSPREPSNVYHFPTGHRLENGLP